MNREIKQMLKFSISIVLIELVFVNLGGIVNQPPAELKTSYASWRVHTNRLRAIQIDQSSEKGAYPKLSGRHLTMAAFPKQNKIYILNNKKVVYILNARINLATGQHQLLVGDFRGPSIFHYNTDGKDIKSINWLSVGQNADIEAEPKLGNHVDDTIQVSKKDAIWLYNNLPKDVRLRIY
ncbi:hypothetical protein ACT5E2_04945 [Limosilactobacillus mucosae]|uniref:hypothetical protein n=1 Tax=Limosilactobacillus mucosae TaxID=97478 RepID=UPI00403A6266